MQIIAAALMTYREMQRREARRLEQLCGYISLIEYVKKQIDTFLLPIDAILSGCDREILKKCGVSLSPPPKTLCEAVGSTKFLTGKRAAEIIREFADGFGLCYGEEQIRSCEYCLGELRAERTRLGEEIEKSGRIRLTLCLCASCSAILLLI